MMNYCISTSEFFGSDRSSRNVNLRPVQVCLEQSIFIFLPRSESNRAVREHLERTQRALGEH